MHIFYTTYELTMTSMFKTFINVRKSTYSSFILAHSALTNVDKNNFGLKMYQ